MIICLGDVHAFISQMKPGNLANRLQPLHKFRVVQYIRLVDYRYCRLFSVKLAN